MEKSLLFDLKKSSEEKIFDAILEKIPENETYFMKHREGTNAFCIRKDKKEVEKAKIITLIKTIDSKIKKSTNKSQIPQLKRMRKELLNRYISLGEIFVDI